LAFFEKDKRFRATAITNNNGHEIHPNQSKRLEQIIASPPFSPTGELEVKAHRHVSKDTQEVRIGKNM
jgi:hypothetical protein